MTDKDKSLVVVSGADVQFVKRFDAATFFDLPKLVAGASDKTTGALEYTGAIKMLSRIIDNWDFPGDPHNVEDYKFFDNREDGIFEVIHMANAAVEYFQSRSEKVQGISPQ